LLGAPSSMSASASSPSPRASVLPHQSRAQPRSAASSGCRPSPSTGSTTSPPCRRLVRLPALVRPQAVAVTPSDLQGGADDDDPWSDVDAGTANMEAHWRARDAGSAEDASAKDREDIPESLPSCDAATLGSTPPRTAPARARARAMLGVPQPECQLLISPAPPLTGSHWSRAPFVSLRPFCGIRGVGVGHRVGLPIGGRGRRPEILAPPSPCVWRKLSDQRLE
jgi:hypothetical protein